MISKFLVIYRAIDFIWFGQNKKAKKRHQFYILAFRKVD